MAGLTDGGIGGFFGGIVDWMGRKNAPQIPQNPFMGDWGTLIGQLQRTASGEGPSLAGNAFKDAHAQGLRDQMSMAAGGSAGGARQAGMNMVRQNQGLAAGFSNARLQEQLASQQALQAALTNAGNSWFMPQQANLQAQFNTQTNGQQLMNFLMQLAQGGATLATKKPA